MNTEIQNRLRRGLEILWTPKVITPRGGPIMEPEATDGALAVRLGHAQRRALQLGPVQAALVTRAQRSLRMIVNLRTGLQSTYVVPQHLACEGVYGKALCRA